MDEEEDASVENREQSVSSVSSNLAKRMEIDEFAASTSALQVIGILIILKVFNVNFRFSFVLFLLCFDTRTNTRL